MDAQPHQQKDQAASIVRDEVVRANSLGLRDARCDQHACTQQRYEHRESKPQCIAWCGGRAGLERLCEHVHHLDRLESECRRAALLALLEADTQANLEDILARGRRAAVASEAAPLPVTRRDPRQPTRSPLLVRCLERRAESERRRFTRKWLARIAVGLTALAVMSAALWAFGGRS